MNNEDVIKLLKTCYTGVVHDVMREMGLKNFTLPNSIKPLINEKVICGPIFTVQGRVDETVTAHETLFAWTGLLSKAKAGHIWVSQPNDLTIAHMGELSAETLHKKGVLGCIVDGGIRDASFIKKLDFQVWRRFQTPRDVVQRWIPTAFDKDVIIGDVLLKPEDFVLADYDGIIRIPKEYVEEITLKSVEAMNTENKVRSAILEGMDPQEAYLKWNKF